jgi:FtsP/CotA-like multicopper oxidase with cupredoxin domain
VVGALVWFWASTLVPSTYSILDMGYADDGGGPAHAHGAAVSVAALTGPQTGQPDVAVELKARKGKVHLTSGEVVDGYTLNGSSPGPLIEATQGDLVQVTLVNVDVPDGITLHWHGVDVPNAEDGVAGVTQDAVGPGEDHTYRFVARDAGTYWYHSHQVSHEQVIGGLLGPLVIRPQRGDPTVRDVVAVSHTYAGVASVNGNRSMRVVAPPGQRVRVREINTDNGPTRTWASAPYRVLAVDGHDVHRPTDVSGRSTVLTAGGRVDVGVVVPRDGSGVRVQVGGATSVLIGPADAEAPEPVQPQRSLDLLSYGSPAPLGFDPSRADRHFTYAIGRRPGFVRGKPGMWWSVNGHLFPDVPMFVVADGDVVRMRIKNSSGDVHPMHLHGHHAVVLARNGVRATGSPWWFDSLNVNDGETYDVAFVADNPGIWMDHCHNLQHAQQGLVAHLMYAGVTEPFRVGGSPRNQPE